MKPVAVAVFGLLVLAVPGGAEAQPEKVRRIGLLGTTTPSAGQHLLDAFRRGLQEHGWIQSQNIAIEYRWAEGKIERLPDLAAELVRLKVEVIFAGSRPTALAAKRATSTVPIVFAGVSDPVGIGLVDSLARPGGNITGVSFDPTPELAVKALELLKEAVPSLSRVVVLWNPVVPGTDAHWKELQAAARAMALAVKSVAVTTAGDLEGSLAQMVNEPGSGLVVVQDPLLFQHRRHIMEVAARNRLPTAAEFREYVDAGGLRHTARAGPIRCAALLRS